MISHLVVIGRGRKHSAISFGGNERKANNFIPAITVEGQLITDQRGKEEAFYKAYKELLCQRSLNGLGGIGYYPY